MGQRNYELLNKAPKYIFWNAMWNSSFCFKNSLYLDFFFKQIIFSVFSFNNSSLFYKNLKNINNKFIYNNLTFFSYDNDFSSSKQTDYLNPYFSKIWLLIYKNWVFLTFFIFYPKGKLINDESVENEDMIVDFFFYHKIKLNRKKTIFNINTF